MSKKDVKDLLATIDWAKRIEIAYRVIVRIIEQTRKHNITSTDYISLLNARYSMAKKMLDFNFENNDNAEYKIELDDTFNKYLSDDTHWQQTQTKINEVLNELNHFMAEFSDVKPSEVIETKYLDELVKPVNTLLTKYHKENSSPNDVIYELTYDDFSYALLFKGVNIYRAKDAGTQVALRSVFAQSGKEREATNFVEYDGKPKSVNTVSMKNNIQTISKMPESLYYLLKTFNSGKGIKVITQITRSDISQKNLNTSEIDEWLNTKI